MRGRRPAGLKIIKTQNKEARKAVLDYKVSVHKSNEAKTAGIDDADVREKDKARKESFLAVNVLPPSQLPQLQSRSSSFGSLRQARILRRLITCSFSLSVLHAL